MTKQIPHLPHVFVPMQFDGRQVDRCKFCLIAPEEQENPGELCVARYPERAIK